MNNLEKKPIPEKKSDSFLDKIANSLKDFKDKIVAPKAPEANKDRLLSKERKENKETGQLKKEAVNLQKDILKQHETSLATAELNKLKKTITVQKPFSTYVAQYPDTQQFLQKSSRIAAPHIAQSADALRNDVARPFLKSLIS
jgi:5'-3' exonuclease